jgi:hypothetical protein
MLSPATTKRSLHRLLTAQRVNEFMRTMVWVAPLTILIWIYAEREQISVAPEVSFPVQVRISSSDRVATIADLSHRSVTVELEGPKVKLDDLRQQLAASLPPGGLVIELDPSTPRGPVNRRTLDLLNNDIPFFKSQGVKVIAASPAQIAIQVDDLTTRELPLVVDDAVAALLEAPPVFSPSSVTVVGPRLLLDRLQGPRPTLRVGLLLAPSANPSLLKTPGPHDLPDIPLTKPQLTLPGEEALASSITLRPDRVRASFKVKQSDVSYTIPSMPVFAVAPGSLLDDYRPLFDPILTNVTVTGSPETIAALKADKLPRKPKALLELSRDDTALSLTPPLPNTAATPNARTLTRRLRFDLPEGLTISPEDQKREIEFSLVPRSKSE